MTEKKRPRSAQLNQYLTTIEAEHGVREDGAHVWEARVRTTLQPEDVIRERAQGCGSADARAYWSHELTMPPFRVPDGFQELTLVGQTLARVYVCPDDLVIVVVQDTELTVIKHVTHSTYSDDLAILHWIAACSLARSQASGLVAGK